MATVAAILGILSLWAVLRRLCASVPSAVLAHASLSSIPLLLPSWTHSVTCRLTIDQVTHKAMRRSGIRSSIFSRHPARGQSCGTTFPCLQSTSTCPNTVHIQDRSSSYVALISATLGSPSPRTSTTFSTYIVYASSPSGLATHATWLSP
ncbi:hypothetical protein B0H14DRAFT_2909126 [Mycena olivaceomarginata]|nr:hypothetical protein B0H14DRAFT_2909126 [Mycena olivaceomarginata]